MILSRRGFGVSLLFGATAILFASCRTAAVQDASSLEAAAYDRLRPSDVIIGNITTPGLSPSMKAFLDTIAAAEGTTRKSSPCSKGNGYRSIGGCYEDGSRMISNFNAHPRGDLSYNSDAAGRYQFISTTWDSLGQPNFKPSSQDRAAVLLIKQVKGYHSIESIPQGGKAEFVRALDILKYQWASLPAKPGSNQPYNQPVKSPDDLWLIYQAAYKIYSSGGEAAAPQIAEESDRETQRPVDLSKPLIRKPRSPECLEVLEKSHGEDVVLWSVEHGTTTVKGENIPRSNMELLQEFIKKCND